MLLSKIPNIHLSLSHPSHLSHSHCPHLKCRFMKESTPSQRTTTGLERLSCRASHWACSKWRCGSLNDIKHGSFVEERTAYHRVGEHTRRVGGASLVSNPLNYGGVCGWLIHIEWVGDSNCVIGKSGSSLSMKR